MDTATLAVLLTFAGTVITTTAGVIVAIVVNSREKTDSATASIEKAREAAAEDAKRLNQDRLTFKDEQIRDLRHDMANLRLKLADAEARADREKDRADHLQMVIEEQRAEEQEKIHRER